jgi:DnaK suppressor protein
VANGTYGQCIECGEPIAPARLEVNPTARRCAECQARHEKASGAP